ncbi:VanZ family protein [Paenibacillus psychroresistens]|uniref:VanZ family protein n=1 Tax=Paenibacillus psychroresistens TaxID=1778678 RepID=A0A6B8RQH6_9BACL|nr:VanZ family protein [Paenibacillus psychroresistens]QGQ98054.1 VanZ family protein [Paenibacillus psychroresistens]
MKLVNIWKIIFVVYICLLLFFVVVKFNESIDRIISIKESRSAGYWNYNLIPFQSMTRYLQNMTDSYAYTNILGNIIPFSPLGFLIPIIFRKCRKFVKSILICFISIIGIETFQFFTMLGYFDIDDILLNTIGCLIGYSVYGVLRNYIKRARKAQELWRDKNGWNEDKYL